jgi:tRNA modification GTPase
LAAVIIDSAGGSAEFALYGPAQPADAVQRSAWNATLDAARRADIVLFTVDRSAVLNPEEARLFSAALTSSRAAARAVLWTKCDLEPAPHWHAGAAEWSGWQRFEVSALSGAGLDALRGFLKKQLAELQARPRDAFLAAAAAAHAAARQAALAIERAAEGLAAGHGEDVVAVELREAIHAFWQAEGVLLRHDAVTEAALDRIFSQFCIGK